MTKSKILVLVIIFLGLFLRLYGNNWDQGWHLHPDERFLTMVGIDIKIPESFPRYLDAKTSPFNPTNKGHAFYVYGTLPLLVNKVIAQQIYADTYDQFNLLGRILSGVADFFVIVVIFKLVLLLEKKLKLSGQVKYFASFFYAIAVLPIQLSHFFTVDTFLNLFGWLSIYFAVKAAVHTEKKLHANTILSGICLGVALACKVSAIYIAPLVGIIIFFGTHKLGNRWKELLMRMAIFGLFCYIAVRLGSPYYFENGNIFSFQLNSLFQENIRTLKSFDNPQALFPPAIQWISKSFDFAIKNIIFFGVGTAYFILSVMGGVVLLAKKNKYMTSTIIWGMALLIYQSLQFAKTMRYLIFIYPLLAVFAAVGFSFMYSKIKRISALSAVSIGIGVFICVMIWPVAFMSIYTKPHSRVAASKWIYKTVPYGSTLLTEYWDDPLPLMVYDPRSKNYIGREVHIFDPDSSEKWKEINTQLAQADYYIMSSNRGWGSITNASRLYPQASRFYSDMFKGKAGYTLIKKFSSYPSLRYLGIPLDFPDQSSEEAFTVYDHPEVMIFKKN